MKPIPIPAQSPLSARAVAVWAYLKQEAPTGICPSYRQIGNAVGISSLSRVSCAIDELEDHGLIRKLAFRRRALELSTRPPCLIRRDASGTVTHVEPLQFIPLRNIKPYNLKMLRRDAA